MESTNREITRLEVYEEAVEVIDEPGRYHAELRAEYSGRAMYGRTVPAIVTNAPGTIVAWAIMCVLAERFDNCCDLQVESESYIPTGQDQMGMDRVYY